MGKEDWQDPWEDLSFRGSTSEENPRLVRTISPLDL